MYVKKERVKIENIYFEVYPCEKCGGLPEIKYLLDKKGNQMTILKCKECGNDYNAKLSSTRVGAVKLWNLKGTDIYNNRPFGMPDWLYSVLIALGILSFLVAILSFVLILVS